MFFLVKNSLFLLNFFCNDNDIDIKQIFHAFLFNIRNYLPEVIDIERLEAELYHITESELNKKTKYIRY